MDVVKIGIDHFDGVSSSSSSGAVRGIGDAVGDVARAGDDGDDERRRFHVDAGLSEAGRHSSVVVSCPVSVNRPKKYECDENETMVNTNQKKRMYALMHVRMYALMHSLTYSLLYALLYSLAS